MSEELYVYWFTVGAIFFLMIANYMCFTIGIRKGPTIREVLDSMIFEPEYTRKEIDVTPNCIQIQAEVPSD